MVVFVLTCGYSTNSCGEEGGDATIFGVFSSRALAWQALARLVDGSESRADAVRQGSLPAGYAVLEFAMDEEAAQDVPMEYHYRWRNPG